MSNESAELKSVQMRVKPETITQINNIQGMLKSSNRTTAAKTSFDIAEMILKQLSEGGHVELVGKDQSRSRIVIPGVGK